MFDLDTAQRVMCETGTPALKTEEVPISRAVGRVLAEPLHADLDAGTRLQSTDVPRLAAMGHPTVRVFRKLKVGVLTLGDLVGPARAGARCAEHRAAGPMLASLLDGLGTVAIAAPRVVGDAKTVDSVLDMLLKECDLVVVAGCVTEARRRELQRTLSTRGASLSDWTLCESLGAQLTVGQLDGKVVVCLPSGLAEAFMAFMLLVSPLIRRLQGRLDALPASRLVSGRRHGSDPKAPNHEFAWAREAELRSDVVVRPYALLNPIDAIAWSDGIARSLTPSVFGDRFEARYYPFSGWLR